MSGAPHSVDLLSLTQAMLSAAEAGNWEEVGKIEVQRQLALKSLEDIISTREAEISVDAVVKHIGEILSLNKRMIDLADQAKTELAKAMGGLHQGRKAVNAYHGIR